MGKLIIVNPPVELTKEEREQLEYIRTVVGKGFIRNYCVKQLPICPKCGKHTFEGKTGVAGLKCSNCGFKVTLQEWLNLDHHEYWEKI